MKGNRDVEHRYGYVEHAESHVSESLDSMRPTAAFWEKNASFADRDIAQLLGICAAIIVGVLVAAVIEYGSWLAFIILCIYETSLLKISRGTAIAIAGT